MKIRVQMSYIPQKKAKNISKLILLQKSMVYAWKNTKKEDFFDFWPENQVDQIFLLEIFSKFLLIDLKSDSSRKC